jgi:hypothetical protein
MSNCSCHTNPLSEQDTSSSDLKLTEPTKEEKIAALKKAGQERAALKKANQDQTKPAQEKPAKKENPPKKEDGKEEKEALPNTAALEKSAMDEGEALGKEINRLNKTGEPVHYFHKSTSSSNGDVKLLLITLQKINEVSPNTAMSVFSWNDDQAICYVHVPQERTELTVDNWTTTISGFMKVTEAPTVINDTTRLITLLTIFIKI